MPFSCGGQTLNLENVPFHMIPKSIIKQSYELNFFLILFCSSGNEDLPFLRTIWEYSEILMGSWQMA